jgi:hypothetical protein
MKLLYLLFVLVNSEPFIRNFNIPSCKNCIHYRPSIHNEFTSTLNKCTLFGEKDIITDEITYDYADTCRRDETKCGPVGFGFKKEKNIQLKIANHTIGRKLPNWLLVLSILWLFKVIIIKIHY